MDFYQGLNYSLGNEDWRVEEQALRVTPGDNVVCITASGDRPLHLLMTDCANILSIDTNAIQTHLLNLKLAAILQLDYEKYIAFLGCTATPHRTAIFYEISPYLSGDAYQFWIKHRKMIQKGILYQGKMERLTHYSGLLFKILRHKKIQTLLSFTDIHEQRDYLKKEWDTFLIRRLFEVVIDPKYTKYLLKDPGLNSFTDFSAKPGKYIYQGMMEYLYHHLAKESPFFQLIFLGKILPEAYYPYLTFEGYKKIRVDISRLQYRTGDVIEFLNNTQQNTFDCFSLSDIASYMPQSIFEKLLRAIVKSASPQARFCLREFLSNRHIPDDLTHHFCRNNQLENKLRREEPHFIYRFMTGKISK